MKRDKIKKALPLLLAALLALSFTLTACGSQEDEDDMLSAAPGDVVETDPYEEMSAVQKAALKKKAAVMNKKEANFYGTWVADDEVAHDLYGNLEITINKDGTFDANVTDVKFSGTWKKVDDGIIYTSELMHGRVYYGDTCEMTIDNEEMSVEEDGLYITMKKVD